MRFIPLLFVLLTMGTVGCATSLTELTAEAKVCVNQSTNLAGVVGATPEQRTACWADVNNRIAANAKRDAERDIEYADRCPSRMVKWCDWKGCVCVDQWEAQEALRRAGFY